VTSFLERIDRWFAKPAPPERLASFRILVGLFTLGYLLVRFPVFWSLADGRASRFAPVGVLSVLTGPLPGWIVRVLVIVAILSAVTFTIGWRHRVSGPALAGSMLALATYRSSWGQLLHFENLIVLHLLVIGLSRSADARSVDARRADSMPDASAEDKSPSVSSRTYGFPLQLAAVITVVTYALAGVAKLRYGGSDWMLGDTLQNHVAYSAARLELLGGNPSPLAGLFVDHNWIFPPLATVSVLLELGAPLALLSPRLRTAWSVAVWLMHVGIAGLMIVVFPYPLFGLAFAPMFQLERWWPGQRRNVSTAPART
jgi:hypothetical protein